MSQAQDLQLGQQLYEASGLSHAPPWAMLGDITKQVWVEKAQRKRAGDPDWYSYLPPETTEPVLSPLFEPCCANERRSMAGGCLNCGDPCL